MADEINRASPRTQSALLQAMQEHCVTVLDATHALPAPFFVLATQNPIEQEGTYPLPEAQLDRFLLKISVGYPSEAEELEVILRTTGNRDEAPQQVMDAEQLLAIQRLVRDTPAAEGVVRYALALVRSTRPVSEGGHADLAPLLRWGAGPRAGQALVLCAKARATLQGRGYVTLDDLRRVAKPVMRHRIQPSYEAEAQGLTPDAIVDKVLALVQLPASELERDPAVAAAMK